MKLANSRIQSLKEMLTLEEKRANLQGELDSIEQRMSALKDAIFSGSPAVATAAPSTSATRTYQRKTTGRRNARGSLKDKIMAALEAAGGEGVRVKELAAALGSKPVNIHSWFHSNIKRNSNIKKLTGGHYRLKEGGKSAAPSVARRPGRPAKGAGASASGGKTVKRGALSAKILDQLKNAGPSGISVSNLSSKIGAKYKNIYVWFATTGKKNPGVKKVGPATYTLVS